MKRYVSKGYSSAFEGRIASLPSTPGDGLEDASQRFVQPKIQMKIAKRRRRMTCRSLFAR